MSKIGLNLLTEAQQVLFDQDDRENIVVSSCTPGYCATDMTSFTGPLSPDEGKKFNLILLLNFFLNIRSHNASFSSTASQKLGWTKRKILG